MSGSGDLQPNSGLRYHTDADSPLPETINPIIDAVETVASFPEIITGSDGIAIKFQSGLMICAGRRTYTFDDLVVDGVTTFEIAFPQPFVADPISITGSLRVGNSLRAMGYTGNIVVFSSTGLTYDIALGDVLRSSGSIEYTAIGFWK